MTGSALLQNAKLVELIKTRFLGVHPDELDCYLEYDDWTRIIAALSVPVSDFTPGIIENTEAGISELVIRDGPTVTGREMTVRPLLDMETREIVGFQWGSAPLPEIEGGDKGDGWHPKDPNGPEIADRDLFPSTLDPFASQSLLSMPEAQPVGEVISAGSPAAEILFGRDIRFYEAMRSLPIGAKLYAAAPSASIEGETP